MIKYFLKANQIIYLSDNLYFTKRKRGGNIPKWRVAILLYAGINQIISTLKMIYNFKDIKGVHLELTTKCNANCPMCGRNAFGVVRPGLPLTELTLADCKKIFPPAFLGQLENISMCGVYGDPILARDLLPIIKYLRSNNQNLKIDVYTNGGIQPLVWWEELARVLGNGVVAFGIDGLGATHQINRQGTKFATIIKNARAFIRAGGKAQWDFIVFKHNEHQIEIARRLSKKLGFKIFQIKRTSRFYKVLYEQDPALHDSGEQFGKYPIYDSFGRKNGYLEPPKNPYYRNDSLKEIKNLIKEYDSLIQYFDQVPIDCQAKKTKGIFVSATGEVYPCCWVYQQVNYGIFYGVIDPLELNEANILRDVGGTGQISAKKHAIKNIVRGKFFRRVEAGWKIRGLANGRPKVCARACGCRLDMHRKQHEKPSMGKAHK